MRNILNNDNLYRGEEEERKRSIKNNFMKQLQNLSNDLFSYEEEDDDDDDGKTRNFKCIE